MTHANCAPGAREAVQEPDFDGIVRSYKADLGKRGHSARTVRQSVVAAERLVAWMVSTEMAPSDLDIVGIERFAAAERARKDISTAAVDADRFLGFLIDIGVATVPPAIAGGVRLVERFAEHLAVEGYSSRSIQQRSVACRHFVVWLHLSGLRLEAADSGVLGRFLTHDCACSHPGIIRCNGRFRGKTLAWRLNGFLRFLAGSGTIADSAGRQSEAGRSSHADAFLDWLGRHRGLVRSTIRAYDRSLGALLPLLGDNPAALDAASIRAAILKRMESVGRNQVAGEARVLRLYLRFLASVGLCRPGLDGAVPRVTSRTGSRLPRHVEDEDIEALIATCDRATASGMRNRAIMLLMARLALRASDIVAMRLGDIDWARGVVRVTGKTQRPAELPLPQDAGDAVRDYIVNARPKAAGDILFLRMYPPYGPPLGSSAISYLVKRAMALAGIDGDGLPASHLFRHSRAVGLLRAGASLETVGALLRHSSLDTTRIYSHVDVPMLMAVAQPWPEDVR